MAAIIIQKVAYLNEQLVHRQRSVVFLWTKWHFYWEPVISKRERERERRMCVRVFSMCSLLSLLFIHCVVSIVLFHISVYREMSQSFSFQLWITYNTKKRLQRNTKTTNKRERRKWEYSLSPFCTGEHFFFLQANPKGSLNLGIMWMMDECDSVGSSWMSCILFVNAQSYMMHHNVRKPSEMQL